METELRLHNLGNLLWVGQVECNIGKGRIQHTSSYIVHLTTHTSRTRVFRIHTCQSSESSLALVHTVSEFSQLVLHTVDFLHRNTRLHGQDFHFHLCRYERNTVGRQVVEILAYLSRRDLDILDQFLLHLLDELLVLEVIMHLLTHLGDGLLTIFLQLLAGANHGNPGIDLRINTLHHFRFRDLDTINGSLMEEELLNSNLLRNRTVWIAGISDTLSLSLQTSYLNIRLQNSLISHNPDNLIYDATLIDRL